MNAAEPMLPSGFEPLEPYVAIWAIDSLPGRDAMRARSTPVERAAFYAAAVDLLEPALDHLDTRPLDAREQRLMQLMLSLAHVSLAEEIQGDEEAQHTDLRAFMPITREST